MNSLDRTKVSLCCGLAMASAWACAVPDEGEAYSSGSEQAIVGGSTVIDSDATSHKTALLFSFSPSQHCSATIIGTRWALTAKHCFDDVAASSVNVYLGNDFRKGLAASAMGASYSDHPSLDVKLIKLDRPVISGDPKFWTQGDEPNDLDGTSLVCYGYGENTAGNLGELRKLTLDPFSANIEGVYDRDHYYFDFTSTARLGLGDSGGPCFYTTSAGPAQITGVYSEGSQSLGREVISSSFRDWADLELTTNPTSLAQSIVGSPAVTGWVAGGPSTPRLNIVARFSDKTVQYRTKIGGTLGSWVSLGTDGAATATTPAALALATKRIVVLTKGSGNNLYIKQCSGDCTSASAWGAWYSTGQALKSAPSVAIYSSLLYVFARRSDNKLYMTTCNIDAGNCTTSSQWSSGVALDSTARAALAAYPPAVSTTGGTNRIQIFDARDDGKIYTRYCTTGCKLASNWTAWASLGGTGSTGAATFAVGKVGVGGWINPRMDLFAVAASGGKIYKRTWHAGAWRPWMQLKGTLGSAPAAASPYVGRLEIYSTRTDGTTLQWQAFGE